jgi:hypothetical protein
MRKPFPLFKDSEIFRAGKKNSHILGKLIEHKQDDDFDTDIEVVDDHVDMCFNELKETIEKFVIAEDPLKLCRNARNEFNGLQRIDCIEEEDLLSIPNSSWYDLVSLRSSQSKGTFQQPN